MSTYILINLLIVFFPLVLSFLPAIQFYKQWKALSISIILVGAPFIIWDMLFALNGVWAFNPCRVLGFRFFGLPIEEILFFITVPYSCLFLYHALEGKIINKKVFYNHYLYLILAFISLIISVTFFQKEYTYTVFLLLAVLLALASSLFRKLFGSLIYWIWIIFGMVLFFIFNYFLTALPIVIYSPNSILNIRILTIPFEDFFYNFCMLTLYLAVYLWRQENQKD